MTPPDRASRPGRGPAAWRDAVTSYLLCTVPRSGSWLLADLLEQTEIAGRPDEFFRPDTRKQWSQDWGIPFTAPYGRYVAAAIANTATANHVFGAKLHWYQLEWLTAQLRALPGAAPGATPEALIARCLPRPRYVHLRRQDTVRQAISYYRASYSDRWFSVAEDDPEEGEIRYIRPIPLPDKPDWGHVRFLENLLITHEQRWNDFFRRAGIVPLEIWYEDLAADHEQALHRVLEFIGVQLPPGTPVPAPRLRKQANEDNDRLAEEYLAHRDSAVPRPPNLDQVRRGIRPTSIHDAEERWSAQPSTP
jgi:trehalose 2-sulfotransferase